MHLFLPFYGKHIFSSNFSFDEKSVIFFNLFRRFLLRTDADEIKKFQFCCRWLYYDKVPFFRKISLVFTGIGVGRGTLHYGSWCRPQQPQWCLRCSGFQSFWPISSYPYNFNQIYVRCILTTLHRVTLYIENKIYFLFILFTTLYKL